MFYYEVQFFEKVVLSLVVFWIFKLKSGQNLAFLLPILSEFCPNNKLYLTSKPHLFSKIEPITSQKSYNLS